MLAQLLAGFCQRDVSDDGAGRRRQKAGKNFIKAVGKGLKKVMSKMGIRGPTSYTGGADFRGGGPRAARWWTSISPAPLRRSAGIDAPGVAEEDDPHSTRPRSTRTIRCSGSRSMPAASHALARARRGPPVDPGRDRARAPAVGAPDSQLNLPGIRGR